MPYDETCADQVRGAIVKLPLQPGETLGETKMFGGLCFTLNGKMLGGLEKSRLIIRLDDAQYAAAIAENRVTPMDLTGKPLRNYAFVNEGEWSTADALHDWFLLAAQFVREHMLVDRKPKKRKKA